MLHAARVAWVNGTGGGLCPEMNHEQLWYEFAAAFNVQKAAVQRVLCVMFDMRSPEPRMSQPTG